jgi:hypothetical protein
VTGVETIPPRPLERTRARGAALASPPHLAVAAAARYNGGREGRAVTESETWRERTVPQRHRWLLWRHLWVIDIECPHGHRRVVRDVEGAGVERDAIASLRPGPNDTYAPGRATIYCRGCGRSYPYVSEYQVRGEFPFRGPESPPWRNIGRSWQWHRRLWWRRAYVIDLECPRGHRRSLRGGESRRLLVAYGREVLEDFDKPVDHDFETLILCNRCRCAYRCVWEA